jgi:hypothetical protein
MTHGDKLDFGALDPTRDEARWERMVAETARRGLEQQRRAHTVSRQLVAWGPAAVAAAAVVALTIWGASGAARGRAAERSREAEQAALLLRWAANDALPPPDVLLQVMGDRDDNR